MNRFELLLVVCFSGTFIVSCISDEADCVIDGSPSGEIYSSMRSFDGENLAPSGSYIGNQVSPSLCDSLVFSSINFSSYEVTLDSAYIDVCNECLEVLHWSGPGCAIEPGPTNPSTTFIDHEWRIAEVAVGDTLLYPPCGVTMVGQFNSDGTASFVMGNSYLVNYELDGQNLNFIYPIESTLALYGGYTGVVEGFLSHHLLSLVPWQVELDQNRGQLVLSREVPPSRILMVQ